MTTPWASLDRELARWQVAGRRASAWWRDDDAVEPTSSLERLLGIGGRHGVPLALAVIPVGATPELARALERSAGVVALQHGYAHLSHAPPGVAGKWELGLHRPLDDILDELERGRRRLETLFGPRFVTTLVPPWNRIDPAVCRQLPRVGLDGLSALGPRDRSGPIEGLRVCNVHCDVTDWKGGKVFRGDRRVLGAFVEHLAARREGRVDPDEPTGVLSHHLDLDGPSWDFLERLLGTYGSHPALEWVSPGDDGWG